MTCEAAETQGPDGLTAGLLAVERGAQLAGARRVEVSAVDQVAGDGGDTGMRESVPR